jgi:purine-binding chemotaxis protein CheW
MINTNVLNDFLSNRYLEVMIDDTVYGISIANVIEILRYREINHVHGQAEYIEGSIVFRGLAIPVMSLRKKFRLESKDYDENTCIIAMKINEKEFGFIVENVRSIVEVTEEQISIVEEFNRDVSNKFIKGVAILEDQIVILDAVKILEDIEF